MTKTDQKIPEGWSVKKLGDIGKVSMCKRIMKHETNSIAGIPFYKIGTFGGKADAYISEKLYLEYRHKFAYPKKGDILISAAGTIGRTVVFNGEDAYFQDSNIVWLANDETKALNKYLLFYYTTNPWYTTTGGAISRLYNENITNAKIILPPLAEQEKIAEILGTWDTAIEKLSALIEQKKRLKKGLMQRLLTGKQRLPGFSEARKKVKLGDFVQRITKKNTENNTNIVTISGQEGFVSQREVFKKSLAGENIQNYYLIRKGDFGYNRSYSNGYPMGAIKRLNRYENAVVSTLYICFRTNEKINPFFLEKFFDSGVLNKELYKIVQEGARNHGLLNVSLEDFYSSKLFIPLDLSEQKAIADILSKADEEITLLTRKLSALKEQKTGLMQKLLTGQIRVKAA